MAFSGDPMPMTNEPVVCQSYSCLPQCDSRYPDMLNCSPRAMTQRYAGASNVQTVIKEASFLGDGGGYVASGSDDGR